MQIQKKFNIKASVLIINYNNAKYLKRSIQSVLSQTYKNIEIIFFDDGSNDNSLDIIKKFYKKKFKVIRNNNRTSYGSYNQMNGYFKALCESKGKLIFFLDSDDYFHRNKINNIIKIYKEKKSRPKIIMDQPIFKYKNRIVKKKRNKIFKSFWPSFSPQSCISMEREFALKVFNKISFKKFPNIWLDFRISVFAYYFNKIIYSNNYLTFYRQHENQESSNFLFLKKNWWLRRLEAHNYIKFFFNRNNLNYKINLDYLITKIVNLFYKFF